MADVRVSPEVVIRDPSTPSQQVGVDGSGRIVVVLSDPSTPTQKAAIAADGSVSVNLTGVGAVSVPTTSYEEIDPYSSNYTNFVADNSKVRRVAGLDDFVVRPFRIESIGGRDTLITHDYQVRKLLELLYVELLSQGESEAIQKAISVHLDDSKGYDTFRLLAAASTNASLVTAVETHLHGWYIFNAAAATRYLKLFDLRTTPKVGTDIPKMTVPIPAGAGANVEFEGGIKFNTGLAFCLTTGVADSDSAALTANDVILNLMYKNS